MAARNNALAWAHDNMGTVAVVAGLGLLAWIIYRSPGKFGADIGRGVVNAGSGIVTGVVDETGKIFGVPSVQDVTDDPYVARYIIDHPRGGHFKASLYASPLALAQAVMSISAYDGRLPSADSKIYAEFPPVNGAGGSW